MPTPPPLVLVAVFAVLMAWLAPDERTPAVAQRVFGACVALAGIGLAVAGVIQFRRARTTVDPRTPEKASTLVAAGVFRYSRNPMYVGMVLLLAGWAIWLDSMLGGVFCALFFVWMDRVQIPREEHHIGALFGDDYRHYCARVRRWL